MDTKLRPLQASFKFQRAQIAEALMAPLTIIEAFDKRENLSTRLVPGVIPLVMDEFIL